MSRDECYERFKALAYPASMRYAFLDVQGEIRGIVSVDLVQKQQQFNAAMDQFNSRPKYKHLGVLVSLANVSLQMHLLYQVWPLSIGFGWQAVTMVVAFLLTDFINGLVHMYMDNNDHYDSLAGPLIANFHLHHKVPQYKKHNLLVVYFMESGSKIWLVGYLVLVTVIQGKFTIHPAVLYTLVYVGILSSFAEVSHYLCHTSTSSCAGFLARCGLLLSKRHHARHHLQDNCSYTFLNGFTDPLLDRIAAVWYTGYKQNTDLHFAEYVVADSESR